MNRRVTWWLSVVPLMLAGVEGAHWLAFRLVYPGARERAGVLAQSGHGYLDRLPELGGIGLALLVCGALLHGREARDGCERVAKPALWKLGLLPPLAFTLQEQLEQLVHGGTPLGAVLEPTFAVGLLLQLPFALLAYLAARLLLRVAEHVGRTLAGRGPASERVAVGLACPCFGSVVAPLRVGALAGGHAERGPPL